VCSLLRDRVAVFSSDRRYRYILTITWDESKPYCVFCMLNPSTADEMHNDPTVERCERRAREWGYGGLVVLNIFAYRSTDPKALYSLDDPVGCLNDKAIRIMTESAGLVVCGWGTHGKLHGRGERVLSLLRACGATPYALQLNGDNSPKHPLYVAYEKQPEVIPCHT
jgi:hypothetical protein